MNCRYCNLASCVLHSCLYPESREQVHILLIKYKYHMSMEVKFGEFCENTTLHGASYVCGAKRHSAQKLLWGFAMLGMLIFFSSQLALSLVAYFKHESFTSIQVNIISLIFLLVVSLRLTVVNVKFILEAYHTIPKLE